MTGSGAAGGVSSRPAGKATFMASLAKQSPVPSGDRVPATKFIVGLPMKPATKTFSGRLKTCSGVPTCWSVPPWITAMREARVMASTWSWVT